MAVCLPSSVKIITWLIQRSKIHAIWTSLLELLSSWRLQLSGIQKNSILLRHILPRFKTTKATIKLAESYSASILSHMCLIVFYDLLWENLAFGWTCPLSCHGNQTLVQSIFEFFDRVRILHYLSFNNGILKRRMKSNIHCKFIIMLLNGTLVFTVGYRRKLKCF